MAEIFFWVALTGVAYVYAGYPLLLIAWRRLRRRPVSKRAWEPAVSLIIPMENEASNVLRKLRNCRDLDYPHEKLQVILSLDAPSDATPEIVRACADPGVVVVSSPVRQGKAIAVNRGAAAANGEILVFGDARQTLEPNAIRELAANFADERVGVVSGALILVDREGGETRDGAGAYWRYEKSLRAMESDIHSSPGATGAIYAMRRSLFTPLPEGTILDDVLTPMRAVLAGYRVIFDPTARAIDTAGESAEREYRRKRRTLAGNYQLLAEMPALLSVRRNPIWLQFISHKVGRLLVPWALAVIFVSNLFLLHRGYAALFAGQILFYGMAALGSLAPIRIATIPYTFVWMNLAVLTGLLQYLRGRATGMWNREYARQGLD